MTQSTPSEEREVKIAVDDLAPVRDRLSALGARCQQPANREENSIFDREDELARRGELLRLRLDASGVRLTFKGPARWEGDVKVREELEVTLGDASEARALIERLGFRAVTYYEKIREEWRLGSTAVALDETPIGAFVEFEGPDAPADARRCGLDPARGEVRSYLELYEAYRRRHPEAPREMRFP